MQVEISKNYTRVEWRDDLMLMCKKAGAEPAIPSVFLFSDTQITNEGFVEDINNLLNSGEVKEKTHTHTYKRTSKKQHQYHQSMMAVFWGKGRKKSVH